METTPAYRLKIYLLVLAAFKNPETRSSGLCSGIEKAQFLLKLDDI